ncbi:MAG: hypothetical protein IKQ49_06610 [Eubacterium sp.]|nr:hypothetical protein [Eubacterium sp.]
MSRIYVSGFLDGVGIKWGLFFTDIKGNKQHLTVKFKQIIYDSEQEAKEKLDAIEAERRREDSATAFSLEEARTFAERIKWKYATTYAKTAPHEYIVKKRLSEDDRSLFERFVQTINANAVVGYFYGHKNNYLIRRISKNRSWMSGRITRPFRRRWKVTGSHRSRRSI